MNIALFLEIKNEYTEHLVDIATPYICEGINSIYSDAFKITSATNRNDKVLLAFQKLLQHIVDWPQNKIEEETNRIKQLSNTTEYFDDLFKAVIKSNIILLTYSNTVSNVIGQSFYNNLTTSTFIHKCYIECGKDAHNNPYIYYHDVEPMERKRNQILIHRQINDGILRAIRKILPISMILKEFLVNSMNIIAEPPKIELVNNIENVKEDIKISEKNNNVEKEVMDIIKSENTKSNKEKIKAIMNLDKIISSIEPARIKSITQKKSSEKNKIDIVITSRVSDKDVLKNKLNKSDKNILNIDLGDSTDHYSQKSVSATTLSGFPIKDNMETTEKIDPQKLNLIENYGLPGIDKNKSYGYSRNKSKYSY